MDANNLKKAFELFVKLQDKKVKLSNVDGKIKYRAPSGIMTNEVIEEIRKCKNELLTIINCTEHPEKLWKGKQGDSFPLTDVQSAYLIGRKNIFQYGNAACHIYMEVEYSELDSQRVEEVWNILINRHPMLRVIFSDTGIQKILRDTPWYTLYTNRNITYTQETLQTELGHKIYDASKWPMFDIGCVSGHNKAILGISIDFMIADWASIWILIDEFEKLYQNPTASLPRIEYNFSDYIYCEKVKKYTPKYFSDREYWIERLAEFPEKPDLPIINAVENIDKNVIFKRYKFVVEKNKWKTIQLISSKMGLTSSAVILSAYAMVISKWSTNKKFVMNLTTLNRNSYESKVNNIVGDFTSINLLAVDFSIQKSFREYVKQIQQQLLTDMEHKFFSGVEVLRELSQGKENIIMPYVFTSGIGVIRNTKKEKRVIAYVEPQPSEFTEDFSLYVLNELKRMLPAYMIPYNIRVMKLPLTSNGKIDRKYLKNIEIVEDKKEADTKNTINSDSSTYFPIKEIWCKLLQRSDIRPDSDLRSFGADSLIMAQAVGKIRNFLKESGSQCDVPFDILLKQTINSPTLSEIVSYIDQIILKKEVNSRYEDAEVNEEELGKLKIHKKGKEDKLVVIFHAGLGSIDEFLPFIQGLCNEEKGTIVSIALNNVKQYLDFYAGHLYESVADKYTKIILDLGYDKIQLIGHCVGGMIAFEVAKNMMDKGVDVIDVSLIDSIPGKYSIEDEVVMELMFLPMVNITYPVLAEYQLNERELYEYMDEKFGKYTGIEQKSKNKVEEYINGLREIEKEERIRLYINSVSKNMPIQMFVYLFDIFKQSTNGAIYKPIPYLGDIRLFIAEDTEKIVFHRSEEVINFWRENCIGDVTVIMIPGNHLTCFTDVNNIQKLVNMITEK